MKFMNQAIVLVTVLLVGVSTSVLAEPVVLTGGWVADFSAAMMETSTRSTTVFQLDGSYKLATQSKGDKYFLVSCVGMEAATKMKEGETITKGSGRCELKDKDGDKILAGMETAFDGFTLKVDGGTGKWSSTKGNIISKEHFTLESDLKLKGYSNAKGEIDFAK